MVWIYDFRLQLIYIERIVLLKPEHNKYFIILQQNILLYAN